jgi:signal transduction histidine kinase
MASPAGWTRATARRDGDRLLVDGICSNVTDRRELAEQLLGEEQRHVRRLQELDRMKDEFVAVVVHELRNPIGVIAGYTELLREDAELADRRELAVIARTSSHLQTLVDDLLDLARLDAGHTTIDARPLVPAKLLRDATAAHQPAVDAQRLTLPTAISCTRIVLGDARRLRQVVDNLLSNAIRYTPAGGTVTVTATSRGIKGTGLGLTIAKAIVEAHHGTITTCPAAGGGTSFTLALPTD